jgi:hypothetical protein
MAKKKLSSGRNAKKDLSVKDQERALELLRTKKAKIEKSYSRVTIDFPPEIYVEMKAMVKEEGRTLKGYIIGLVKKDFKNR